MLGHYLFQACERGIAAVESFHGHRPAGETHGEDHTMKNMAQTAYITKNREFPHILPKPPKSSYSD